MVLPNPQEIELTHREELQVILEDILDSEAVYFQPPPSFKMTYPCIVYQHRDEQVKFAGNRRYMTKKLYQVTVIDRNPDSLIPDTIAELPFCGMDRRYVADGLNHVVFNLYF